MEEVLKRTRGLGLLTLERLKRIGLSTPESVGAAPPGLLADLLGIPVDKAVELVEEARREVRLSISTALEVLEERKKRVEFISTGVRGLDPILGGGIETGCITEFVGEFGAGKTQLCHQLAVMVQLPPDRGGLSAKAIYIDTEGTFRPERVVQMAKYRGMEPERVLSNIFYARAYGVEYQIALIREARELVERGARLLILDNLIGNFRAEYLGEEGMRERQRRLGEHLRDLRELAEDAEIAIVVTNHVLSKPGILGNPLRPAGGNVVSHAVAHRVWLRRIGEGKWAARVYDSPSLPEAEAIFVISEFGVLDG